MTSEELASLLWHGLNDCAALDKIVAVGTASAWLEYHGAGVPDVPLMQEQVRRDAMFWADIAGPTELEAYAVASITALGTTPLTAKQIKRLAAMSWRRMSQQDRAAFKEWIESND